MLCSSRTRQVKQLQTVQIPGNRTHAGVTQLVTQERGHSGLRPPPSTSELLTTRSKILTSCYLV